MAWHVSKDTPFREPVRMLTAVPRVPEQRDAKKIITKPQHYPISARAPQRCFASVAPLERFSAVPD